MVLVPAAVATVAPLAGGCLVFLARAALVPGLLGSGNVRPRPVLLTTFSITMIVPGGLMGVLGSLRPPAVAGLGLRLGWLEWRSSLPPKGMGGGGATTVPGTTPGTPAAVGGRPDLGRVDPRV